MQNDKVYLVKPFSVNCGAFKIRATGFITNGLPTYPMLFNIKGFL